MYASINYYMYIFNHNGTEDFFRVVNFNSGTVFDPDFLGPDRKPNMAQVNLRLSEISRRGQLLFALRTNAITMRFFNAMNSGLMIHRMGLVVEPYETQINVTLRDSPGFVMRNTLFMFRVKPEKVWMRLKDPNIINKDYGIIDPFIDVVQVSFNSARLRDYQDYPVGNLDGSDDPRVDWTGHPDDD